MAEGLGVGVGGMSRDGPEHATSASKRAQHAATCPIRFLRVIRNLIVTLFYHWLTWNPYSKNKKMGGAAAHFLIFGIPFELARSGMGIEAIPGRWVVGRCYLPFLASCDDVSLRGSLCFPLGFRAYGELLLPSAALDWMQPGKKV
jgi:hypothetical protein